MFACVPFRTECLRAARTVRNAKIDTRSARAKLSERREPYWTVVARGCAVGYRRGAKGGTWVARWRDPAGKHHYRALGAADDALDANDDSVLSYGQTQARARRWFAQMGAARLAVSPDSPCTRGRSGAGLPGLARPAPAPADCPRVTLRRRGPHPAGLRRAITYLTQ